MKLWLDDVREAPSDDYITCKTYEECIEFLHNDIRNHIHEIDEIDLDHDLGTDKTGYDVILWLEQLIWEHIKIPKIIVHTQNVVAAHRMKMAIMCICKTVERLEREKS